MRTLARIEAKVVEDRGVIKLIFSGVDFKRGKAKGFIKPILVKR